jgi:hypothetical protein
MKYLVHFVVIVSVYLTGTINLQAYNIILIDFGADSTYRGASPDGPDTKGYIWNSIDFADTNNLVDIYGELTAIDFNADSGYETDSYNGPAGETTEPVTAQQISDALANTDSAALGRMGNAGEAVFDFVTSPSDATSPLRFILEGLDNGSSYDLAFFGSKKYPIDGVTDTTYTVYSDSGYSTSLGSDTLTVGVNANHNEDALATITGISPVDGNLYIEINDSSSGTGRGYVNCMMLTINGLAESFVASPDLTFGKAVEFSTVNGSVYSVEASDNPGGPFSQIGVVTGDGSTYRFTDERDNSVEQFYRVQTLSSGTPGTAAYLFDLGSDSSYRGASVTNPDGNSNYWNSVYAGAFFADVLDKDGNTTAVSFGFATGQGGASDYFNGPSGATEDPSASVYNSTALGDLGIDEAVYDWYSSSGYGQSAAFVIGGLDSGKKYDLTFYGAKRFPTDETTTTFTVYTDNTYSVEVASVDLTIGNGGSGHNQDATAVLQGIAPQGTSLYIGFEGANGGTGYLNCFEISETVLTTEALANSSEDSTPNVEFDTVSGQTYEIYSADEPGGPFVLIGSIVGTGGTVHLADPRSFANRRFYQFVEVGP